MVAAFGEQNSVCLYIPSFKFNGFKQGQALIIFLGFSGLVGGGACFVGWLLDRVERRKPLAPVPPCGLSGIEEQRTESQELGEGTGSCSCHQWHQCPLEGEQSSRWTALAVTVFMFNTLGGKGAHLCHSEPGTRFQAGVCLLVVPG